MNPKQIKIVLDSRMKGVCTMASSFHGDFPPGSVRFIILPLLRRRIVWHNWKVSKVTTSDSISENCRVEIKKGERILNDLLKIAIAVAGSIAFCPPPVTSHSFSLVRLESCLLLTSPLDWMAVKLQEVKGL